MVSGGAEPRLELRSRDVVWRTFDRQEIVLDLRSSTYMAINATGSVLWRKLEHGATRSELVAALLAEFEVAEDEAATDVDAFLEACTARNLLRDTSEEPSEAEG